MRFANLDISKHPGFLAAQRHYENLEPEDGPEREKSFKDKIDCASLTKVGLIKKILLERLKYEKVEYLLECVEDACDENEWKDFVKQEIESILDN